MIRHLARQVGVRHSFSSVDLRFALMAGAPPPAPTAGADDGARGLRALAPALLQVRWPPKFGPEMPPHYDGATDPSAFLLAYEEAVLEAGGDDKVMAN